MIKIKRNHSNNVAQVDECGVLLVGIDGFTLQDLADRYPGIQIGLHVKDGDKWVPVTIRDIKNGL